MSENPTSVSQKVQKPANPKSMVGLRKIIPDPIELHKKYISLILTYTSAKATDVELDLLACYSYFDEITPKVKKLLAAKHQTSVNSISNAITRLRKRKLVIGRKIHPKLKAPGVKKGTGMKLVIELIYNKP
jgi:hypothetical protein